MSSKRRSRKLASTRDAVETASGADSIGGLDLLTAALTRMKDASPSKKAPTNSRKRKSSSGNGHSNSRVSSGGSGSSSTEGNGHGSGSAQRRRAASKRPLVQSQPPPAAPTLSRANSASGLFIPQAPDMGMANGLRNGGNPFIPAPHSLSHSASYIPSMGPPPGSGGLAPPPPPPPPSLMQAHQAHSADGKLESNGMNGNGLGAPPLLGRTISTGSSMARVGDNTSNTNGAASKPAPGMWASQFLGMGIGSQALLGVKS